jgi:hypothetical protein
MGRGDVKPTVEVQLDRMQVQLNTTRLEYKTKRLQAKRRDKANDVRICCGTDDEDEEANTLLYDARLAQLKAVTETKQMCYQSEPFTFKHGKVFTCMACLGGPQKYRAFEDVNKLQRHAIHEGGALHGAFFMYVKTACEN